MKKEGYTFDEDDQEEQGGEEEEGEAEMEEGEFDETEKKKSPMVLTKKQIAQRSLKSRMK